MISTQWMRRTPSVGPSSSSRKGIALLHSSISAAARVRNSAGDTVQRTASPSAASPRKDGARKVVPKASGNGAVLAGGAGVGTLPRSDERRGEKEGVGTGRSRWEPYH